MEKKETELERRKTETVSSTKNHEKTSEMHKAIRSCNKVRVKELLDKGERLCNGFDASFHRENCFTLALSYEDWDFMEFLLTVDPEAGVTARNHEGKTLLMLCAENHDVEQVKLLLELGADPNDSDYHNNKWYGGSTALILAVSKLYPTPIGSKYSEWFIDVSSVQMRQSYKEKCQYIVDLLIEKGADVNICSKHTGENALHIAVRNQFTFHVEILQSLISAGVDPTVLSMNMKYECCTLLSYAMETFVELCKEFEDDSLDAKEMYRALHYIFHLAPFQSDFIRFCCPVYMHPQTILLRHLSLCQRLTGNQTIFIDLLANTSFLDTELVVRDAIPIMRHDLDHVHSPDCLRHLPLGPLALYLNNEQYWSQASLEELFLFVHNVMENVQQLMSVGLKCVTLQQTLSPLTVGLLNQYDYPHFNYVGFAKIMIDSGVHVEQRMLKCSAQDEELEQLSADLCLPDVISVALSQSHLSAADTLELVKMMLPHFAHPGLTLLPFLTPEKVATLFPFLSSCGSLQNTALHTKVKQRILNSGWLSDEHLHTFNQLNSCVPRLQALCRTVVRAHLAPRASQHGNSLPGLISFVPPLVTVSQNLLLDVAPFLK